MRRIKMVLLVCVLFPATLFAGDDLWDKQLPFESATITYSVDGMETGTEVLYIKDYGRVTAEHHTTSMSMMGMKMETRTLELVDPDWVYTYDLTEGTGSKAVNPIKLMQQEYDKLSRAEKKQVRKNAEQLSVNVMQGGDGKVEQNVSEMFGFSLDRTTVMGVETYVIHDTDIPLKSSGSMMGMQVNVTATEFKKGAVDAAAFKHPEGIVAEVDAQADAMARSMAEKTMAWLKDPDAAQKAPPTPSAAEMYGGGQQPAASEGQGSDQGSMDMEAVEGMLKSILGNQ